MGSMGSLRSAGPGQVNALLEASLSVATRSFEMEASTDAVVPGSMDTLTSPKWEEAVMGPFSPAPAAPLSVVMRYVMRPIQLYSVVELEPETDQRSVTSHPVEEN